MITSNFEKFISVQAREGEKIDINKLKKGYYGMPIVIVEANTIPTTVNKGGAVNGAEQ